LASAYIHGFSYTVFLKKTHKVLRMINEDQKMKIFAPKCSAEITVYQSIQNLCEWVKYSLLNSRKWLRQQDGSPLRRSIRTLAILQTKVPPDFIKLSKLAT